MRSRALLMLATLLLLWVPAQLAQPQRNPRLVMSLEKGGYAAFKVEVTPLKVQRASGQNPDDFSFPFIPRVIRGPSNVLHRMLVDEQGHLMFVYDLVIQELESPKRFRVSARPPTTGIERRLRIQNPEAFAGVTDSRGAVPTLTEATAQQTIEDGETFALDLLVNEPLGVKIVDYVTVASQRWLLFPRKPAQPPRDFGLSNVELALRNYELFIDDVPILSSNGKRNCTGALVWFSLPGEGRFIFSLVPYEGYDFRKVGVIEDNRIVFEWKDTRYEWVSRAPIVGSGGAWNLWILHEPDYVDRFAPGAVEKEHKVSRKPALFPDPIGITLPPPKRKPNSTTLRTNDRKKPEWLWITIGGAKRIEELLSKK